MCNFQFGVDFSLNFVYFFDMERLHETEIFFLQQSLECLRSTVNWKTYTKNLHQNGIKMNEEFPLIFIFQKI